MGTGSSQRTPQFVKSKQIDEELMRQKQTKTIKLLLLGTSECGRSTILKQMRIMRNKGFSEHERHVMRFIVYMNVLKSMHALILAMEPSNMNFRTPLALIVSAVIEEQKEYEHISQSLEQSLIALWADENIQFCYEHRDRIHLADSAKYFLDDIQRICKPDYTPSDEDLLYLRIPTCGAVEVTFVVQNTTLFRVVDVGGQRSQRRKWIHVFDDVNSIIFLTAINEFDQLLCEDQKTNRMTESLDLFDEICNSSYFSVRVSVILFLNKTDLFEQKLQKSSIRVAFPDYTGSQDYEESIKYTEKQFLKLKEKAQKKIYSHQTCATNTNQVQLVLISVIDTIQRINNKNAGLA